MDKLRITAINDHVKNYPDIPLNMLEVVCEYCNCPDLIFHEIPNSTEFDRVECRSCHRQSREVKMLDEEQAQSWRPQPSNNILDAIFESADVQY